MSHKKKRKLEEAAVIGPGAVVLKAGAPADDGEMDRAAWQLFADEYHDIVEQLPLELKRSLLLVGELEHHMQSSQEKLHSALIQYIGQKRDFTASAKRRKTVAIREEDVSMSNDDPASLFSARDRRNTPPPPSPKTQIRNLASEIAKDSRIGIRAGEDKVQQANAMYDTVDRHIRRLDADLAKYEDSLVIGLRAGTLPSSEAPSLFAAAAYTNASTSVGARGGQERPSAAITAAASVADDHTRGVRVDPKAPPLPSSPATPQEKPEKTKGRGRRKAAAEKEPSEQEEEDESSDILIDPDDRLYCHCKRVSFGDMIACDNEECPTEWYHYECVGLKEAPRGRWYCRDCVQAHGVQARKTPRR